MRRGLGIAGAILFMASRAEAQSPDVATAQALFEDGKRLMQQGRHDEACPKLVESQRLDPGGGTLLAIALCHEGQGKTATAWADYDVALAQARKDGRADREQTAIEHMRGLEPKLVRVRVIVAQKVDGLEVRRGGELVSEAQWGSALPVDPGDHVFEASAPNTPRWSETVSVRSEGRTVDVKVPSLAPSVRASNGDDDDGSSQRLWGGIVAGVGVVGITVGSVLGLSARNHWNDAVDLCRNSPCSNKEGIETARDAGKAADASTVFFIVGGLTLAAGAVLWLTAPSAKASRASNASVWRRLLVEGAF